MNEMIKVATNGIWVRIMMKTRAGSSGTRLIQPCLFSQRSLKGGLGSFFLAALESAVVSTGVAVAVAICAIPPHQVAVNCRHTARALSASSRQHSIVVSDLGLRRAQP